MRRTFYGNLLARIVYVNAYSVVAREEKKKEREREKYGRKEEGTKPEIALTYAVRGKKKEREKRRNLVDFSPLR